MGLQLTSDEQAMRDGKNGPAQAFCMDLLHQFSQAVGAQSLIKADGAHIDGCLYHGQVSLDFVDHLVGLGDKVVVPTTLNVGSVDLIHPELFLGTVQKADAAKRLMDAHIQLGCEPSFTCAPYQLAVRPKFGDQLAWGESNAIVFANSVLGARTERYGDFIDLACAITGRVPAYGLHLTENRKARVLVSLDQITPAKYDQSMLAVAVGLLIGAKSSGRICAIEGLPLECHEDDLKALGAAAASAGSVGMFHAIGLTPEAASQEEAFQGAPPAEFMTVTDDDIDTFLSGLSTAKTGQKLSAISLGTPHFSITEFARLMPLLDGNRFAVPFYINTSRATYDALIVNGWRDILEQASIKLVLDTCVYVTTILDDLSGAVMTNSGKMAYYGPANLGCEIAFGSLEDCVRSARSGKVVLS